MSINWVTSYKARHRHIATKIFPRKVGHGGAPLCNTSSVLYDEAAINDMRSGKEALEEVVVIDLPICPICEQKRCTKISYLTTEAAEFALRQRQKYASINRREKRYYWCELHQAYHLTSQERRSR